MPKKNLLIAGAVVVLLIIGVVGFMLMKKPSTNSASEMTTPKDTAQGAGGVSTTKESIRSLFSAGKNVTCTFTYADNSTSGTIYVADKKIRSDFTIKDASGKMTESHMIQDGDTGYFWTGTQGTKMKIDTSVKASPAAGSAQQGADLDKQQDMKCSSWSIDGSKFTVPTDVKFMDVSGFTGQTQTQTQTQTNTSAPSNSSVVKSACETITDPANKAACLNAAGSGGY